MVFLPWHLVSAYLLDLAAGDPHWMPHPVRWIGRLIARTENVLYVKSAPPVFMLFLGFALWIIVIAVVVCAAKLFIAIFCFAGSMFGNLALIWLAYSTLATRSLHNESSHVAEALRTGDLALARARLSFIVSRETSQLDPDAILRALLETVSENISDAIVAPLFYMAFFGPVGALAYKAINTMDSMLGYKNERYIYFGRFAARADDLANWVPARISGWLLVGASICMGMDWRAAANIMKRDAPKMKSPNAGYPEAATAGALGVQLGGTNYYFGQPVEKPLLGEPINRITLETYGRTIRLMYLSSGLAFLMAVCVRLVISN
jgi:adenosylcobinamide-phosphate synthase